MENKNKKVKYDGKPFEHEFDGIKELNNAIPPWLLYMWYISVFFAVVYIVYYHVYEIGDLQEAEYVNQMAKAEAKLEKHKAEAGQFAVVLLTDDGSLAAGKAIFNEKLCITCHAALGEGNTTGPNLTDNYWLHGKGKVEDVFNTIKNGVPTKGMTPYKDQLSEKQILQVSSFILEKLVGSNPPNAKEPQGTLAK
jgi:cytochrome c oxidase cbb3-type subunit 3